MFKSVDYYNSADEMPIGRYMMATCKDLRYYAKGELPKRINKKHLKKAVSELNASIIKNGNQKQVFNDIVQLSKDEANLYLQSSLVSVIAYCNELIAAGADSDEIMKMLKPIQPLLISRGLTPDSKRNANRLEKYARNFKIKSNEIRNKLKNKDVDRSMVYEAYLRNLITIERVYGIKINEQTDSINKYVLLIDELHKQRSNGNRSKSKIKSNRSN